MVFCFVQKLFFGQHKSQNILFSQNLTLGYMTKTLNQIIFFFLHQNQNIFFSNIGNQNIFFQKKNITPPAPRKLNGPSLRSAQRHGDSTDTIASNVSCQNYKAENTQTSLSTRETSLCIMSSYNVVNNIGEYGVMYSLMNNAMYIHIFR